MAFVDLYAVLNVPRDASTEHVVAAYRTAAKQHHPDKNGGAPEATIRMQQINRARDVLCDPARRAQHDQELDAERLRRQAPPAAAKNAVRDPFASLPPLERLVCTVAYVFIVNTLNSTKMRTNPT